MSHTSPTRYTARTDNPVRRSPAHPAHRRRGPGATASLALLASIIVSLLAASSAPTPLYAIYQQHWGFSPITITVVFGVYALAVLISLLVVGKISDHVGRRPVLLAALSAQAAAMVIFATAGGRAHCWPPVSSRAWAPAPRSARSAPACSTSTRAGAAS